MLGWVCGGRGGPDKGVCWVCGGEGWRDEVGCIASIQSALLHPGLRA